ncbi:MAG: hypothetical protein JXR37_06880 [Kiritimatiellae bacterium]|nr:hypothetical protein [Kiritimatiellia bacterium]
MVRPRFVSKDALYAIVRTDAGWTLEVAKEVAEARGFELAFEVRRSGEVLRFTLDRRAPGNRPAWMHLIDVSNAE